MNDNKNPTSLHRVTLDTQAAVDVYESLMKMTAEQLKDWRPSGKKKAVSQTSQARVDLMQELRESLQSTKIQIVAMPVADDALKLV